jgi:hypothetical protein
VDAAQKAMKLVTGRNGGKTVYELEIPLSAIGMDVKKAAQMINASERPIVYFGGGVRSAAGCQPLRDLLEKTGMPATYTLMAAGVLSYGEPHNLGMLGYFKYFNFLGELFTMAAGGEWLKMNIFLPVGISFFTFQSISYVIDVYRGRIQPLGRWIDYVFYVSFFPQLVAGPIVRARDFIPQMYKNPTVTRSEFGEGLFLILCGLFKKTVISDYISMNFVDRIFDAPLLYTDQIGEYYVHIENKRLSSQICDLWRYRRR